VQEHAKKVASRFLRDWDLHKRQWQQTLRGALKDHARAHMEAAQASRVVLAPYAGSEYTGSLTDSVVKEPANCYQSRSIFGNAESACSIPMVPTDRSKEGAMSEGGGGRSDRSMSSSSSASAPREENELEFFDAHEESPRSLNHSMRQDSTVQRPTKLPPRPTKPPPPVPSG